jgi:hypothetical protein
LFRSSGFPQGFIVLHSLPGNEAIKVVAVRPEGPKVLLVKEPLDPAAQANLVGVFLDANRPTHLAMPAAAQDHHRSPGYAGSHNPQGPRPT